MSYGCWPAVLGVKKDALFWRTQHMCSPLVMIMLTDMPISQKKKSSALL